MIMKRHALLMTSLAVLTLQLGLSACAPVNSSPRGTNYYCGTSKNAPATIARTTRGDRPVIRWVSEYFTKYGWNPQQRCLEISDRFQTYYDTGLLGGLTTGKINNQKVICVAKDSSSGCSGLLITLEQKDNPNQVLKDLLDPSAFSAERGVPSDKGTPSEQEPLYIQLDKDLRSPN